MNIEDVDRQHSSRESAHSNEENAAKNDLNMKAIIEEQNIPILDENLCDFERYVSYKKN